MSDAQDNFKASQSNITPLKGKTAFLPTVPRQDNGIIESGISSEENIMPQDTYSKSEIDLKLDKINSDTRHGFEKIDLKFDQLKQEMRSGFEKIDLKFDNFEKRVETMLLTQENKRLEDQARNRKEFMYWFIGLLVSTLLGILAIIVTILTTK
ncbi:hypothetical protein [Streptococcus cristatus]|nr:hypothetical protein [Streptococcus cristatus]